MTTPHHLNRRRFERQPIFASYSEITVRRLGNDAENESISENAEVAEDSSSSHAGHVYDISEGGLRLELDEPMEAGTRVALNLRLPGEEQSWSMTGAIVWVNDELDDPGPRRMALEFSEFGSESDHRRLVSYLGRGMGRIAA